jgi:fumarylacetoacetase
MMTTLLDDTHDPALKSWVASANAPHADFPVQNLPLARLRKRGTQDPWRVGVAIGDQVLDLKLALAQCPWPRDAENLLGPLAEGDLLALMRLGAEPRRAVRAALSQALREGSDQGPFLELCLAPQAEIEFDLPCRIGDYTDFYTGIHHATTVGKLFRPDNPLLPNYKWVPIGYHGRTSSIRVSGHSFARPRGQIMLPDAKTPVFEPCRRLDYELEMGVFVGAGNADGMPIPMERAEDDWFGMVLLNDWSARDVQAWEYQPLGPFLSKSFATTLSPWIVTREALSPFRRPFTRPEGDPQPLPYLDSAFNRNAGAVDITLEVFIRSEQMRAAGQQPHRLSKSNFGDDAYWTIAQLIAHHSSNGCNLMPGDLLGTGTQSGPRPEQGGSLLELSAGGKQPITLPGGETRTFLADGDTVIFRAYCAREGAARVGFGTCVATVAAAV